MKSAVNTKTNSIYKTGSKSCESEKKMGDKMGNMENMEQAIMSYDEFLAEHRRKVSVRMN